MYSIYYSDSLLDKERCFRAKRKSTISNYVADYNYVRVYHRIDGQLYESIYVDHEFVFGLDVR